ncbi:probable E3 ubiquitin-protein ligase HERC2 isoform X2 [Ostrea edulis]|uniref:probable E3 ubiquitin-protein ligase HERC2 isoform X2 n=1 Tax=Ostrea edulis TaxID=37623 RepID=UPI0024AFAE77|nr:probable E3 ubiquitin-protein ligase HERC2 isoform X2 [Ostrea edulis]
MSLPTFSPPHMNTEKLRKLFGSLRVPDVSRNTSRRGASATKAPEVLRNSAGAPAKKDYTGKYYCGRKVLRCRCCDGYCGPDNSCNCEPCQELALKEQLRAMLGVFR